MPLHVEAHTRTVRDSPRQHRQGMIRTSWVYDPTQIQFMSGGSTGPGDDCVQFAELLRPEAIPHMRVSKASNSRRKLSSLSSHKIAWMSSCDRWSTSMSHHFAFAGWSCLRVNSPWQPAKKMDARSRLFASLSLTWLEAGS